MSKVQVCHDKDDSLQNVIKINIHLFQQEPEAFDSQKGCSTHDFSRDHCLTGSHSSSECRQIEESKRKGGTGRSKSTLDEASNLKTTFMQGLTECERNTYGSHGDGLLHDQNSENKRVTEVCEKKKDKQRKLQIQIEGGNQAFGVSQNLFDAQLTFADLVRVCSTQTGANNLHRKQLGNSLLAKSHASSFVSSYLNTYRGYLDSLRKTSGRGHTVPDCVPLPKIVKNVPQVLPLGIGDDNRDDPEFLHLLRKTTTDSIRKLWPNKGKTNIVNKTGSSDGVQTTEKKTADNFVKNTNTKLFELYQDIDVVNSELARQGENTQISIQSIPEIDDNEDCLLTMTSITSDSFDWGKSTMTETTAPTLDQNPHQHQQIQQSAQHRPHFPTGSLLKHQQKLIHQHNLQRQILKHQQQLQQQQEQQKQQLQHHQQQQQQQQLQQHIPKHQHLQNYQPCPQLQSFQYHDQPDQVLQSTASPFESVEHDDPKPWFARTQENSNTSAYNYHLQSRHLISDNCNNSQLLASGSNTMLLPNTNQNEFDRKNQYQEHIDSFYDPRRKYYQEEVPRTLKASYACLDPSTPMALSRLESMSASPLTDLSTGFNQFDNGHVRQPHDYFSHNYGDLLGEKSSVHGWGDQMYADKTEVYNDSVEYEDHLRGSIGRHHTDNPFGHFGRQQQTRPTIKRDLQMNAKPDCLSNEQQMFLDFNALGNSQDASLFQNNDRQEDWSSVAIDQLMTNGGMKKSPGSTLEHTRPSQLSEWGKEGLPSDVTVCHPLGSLRTTDKSKLGDSKLPSGYSSREIPCSWADSTTHKTNSMLFTSGVDHSSKRGDPQMQFSNNNNACWTNKDKFDTTKESSLLLDHMMETERSSKWLSKERQLLVCNGAEEETSDNGTRKGSENSKGRLQTTVCSKGGSLPVRNSSTTDNNSEAHKITSSASSPGEISRSKEHNRLCISRTQSENSDTPHSSASFPQLNQIHQQPHVLDKVKRQNKKIENDETILKLSQDFENTFLDENTVSPPWHELSMPTTNSEKRNEFIKVQNFDGATMILSDTELSLYPDKEKRSYSTEDDPQSESKEHHRPRMILGGNNNVRKPMGEEERIDIEEGNRKLREMLGLPDARPEKDMSNIHHTMPQPQPHASARMPELQPQTHYTTLPDSMNQRYPNIYQQNGMQTMGNSPMTRVQFSGNKMPQHIGMPQQMYCMAPNILVPPPPIGGQGPNRNHVLYPQMIQNVSSASRVPQGMIRVPLVYMQPMPMGMTGLHPTNNNHNNSSSSNPHVNTSNIITINTSENDFSNGEKGSRGIKSNIQKKPTLLKIRQIHDEFPGTYQAFSAPTEDHQNPRLRRTRTNPWDSDLDHDFSNSLISKGNSLDSLPGSGTQNEVLDYNGMNFPDMSGFKLESESSAYEQKTNPSMQQWSAAADMHPEQLDMLPVKRAMPEEAGAGRVCWPDMELMIPTSRDHMQAARRSNKPMGSNRANLISIIPKTCGDV